MVVKLLYQNPLSERFDISENHKSEEQRPFRHYSGLVGYNKANQWVKNKAQREEKLVEQWSLLTYIKKQLTKSHSQKLTKWLEIKTQGRKMSWLDFYIP